MVNKVKFLPFYFNVGPHHAAACGISVPKLGAEPMGSLGSTES